MLRFSKSILLSGSLAMAMPLSSAFADQTQFNIDRLLQAAAYLGNAAETIRNSCPQTPRREIRMAYYRIRIAAIDLEGSRYYSHQARNALALAQEKLTDPMLRNPEKLYFGLECLGVGLKHLIDDAVFGPRKTKQFLKVAEELAKAYVHPVTIQVLEAAKASARRSLGCPLTARGVIDAIDVAIDKLTDPYLNDAEKEFFTLDCIRVALEKIAAAGL